MKRFLLMVSASALLASSVLVPASLAGSRYASPPPTVLSPDLTSPWVMQLHRKPGTPRGYGARITPPRPAYRQQRQVRRSWNRPSRQTQLRTFNRKATRHAVQTRHSPRHVTRQSTRQYASVQRRQQPVQQKPQLDPRWLPANVSYETSQKRGTIIIDTHSRYLYLVLGNGQARRYGVGVGKPGFEWAGTHKVSRKAEWPDWRPPVEMIARERAKGRELPRHMEGGPSNPLGARALYLGSTLYRIHGTNQPWSIGQAVSSGCIRMRNEDVMDLYERVPVGAKVVVS